MKREIKFRFWLGGTNKMTYTHSLEELLKMGWDLSDDIIPLQYTGLRDKNGTEIYEGDLLDFDEEEWGGKFEPEEINFELITGSWDLCGSLSDLSKWRRVVGNIYEQ